MKCISCKQEVNVGELHLEFPDIFEAPVDELEEAENWVRAEIICYSCALGFPPWN